MKYIILSGSNRNNSGSRKVSNYVAHSLKQQSGDITILDMHEENLPMWTEDMWNAESEQSKNWQKYSQQLQDADGIVVVAAEWAGSIPASLRNFILHMSSKDVAHKPALIVSVSAGTGGTYPIAELRSFSAKNNHMIYIPDHVIVRKVNDVLDTLELNEEDKDDFWIKGKINRAIGILKLYTHHMKKLREEGQFDLDDYPYGM